MGQPQTRSTPSPHSVARFARSLQRRSNAEIDWLTSDPTRQGSTCKEARIQNNSLERRTTSSSGTKATSTTNGLLVPAYESGSIGVNGHIERLVKATRGEDTLNGCMHTTKHTRKELVTSESLACLTSKQRPRHCSTKAPGTRVPRELRWRRDIRRASSSLINKPRSAHQRGCPLSSVHHDVEKCQPGMNSELGYRMWLTAQGQKCHRRTNDATGRRCCWSSVCLDGLRAMHAP
jgi:hypothetical protein